MPLRGKGLSFVTGFTANKLLKGAGAGADPTEIDVPGSSTGTYTGDTTANRAIAHGLGKTPKFVFLISERAAWDRQIWFKALEGVAALYYFSDHLADRGSYGVSAPDATNFYVGNATDYNRSAQSTNEVYTWFAWG